MFSFFYTFLLFSILSNFQSCKPIVKAPQTISKTPELDPKIIVNNVLQLKLMFLDKRYNYKQYLHFDDADVKKIRSLLSQFVELNEEPYKSLTIRIGLAQNQVDQILKKLNNKINNDIQNKIISVQNLNNDYFNKIISENLPQNLKIKIEKQAQLSDFKDEKIISLTSSVEALRSDFYFHNVFFINEFLNTVNNFHKNNDDCKYKLGELDLILGTIQKIFSTKLDRKSHDIIYVLQNYLFRNTYNQFKLHHDTYTITIQFLLHQITRIQSNLGNNKGIPKDIEIYELFHIWNTFNAARLKLIWFLSDISVDEYKITLSKILTDIVTTYNIDFYENWSDSEKFNTYVSKILFKHLPSKFSPSIISKFINFFRNTKDQSQLLEKIKLAYHDFYTTNLYLINKYFEYLDTDNKKELVNLLKCVKFQLKFESDEKSKKLLNMLLQFQNKKFNLNNKHIVYQAKEAEITTSKPELKSTHSITKKTTVPETETTKEEVEQKIKKLEEAKREHKKMLKKESKKRAKIKKREKKLREQERSRQEQVIQTQQQYTQKNVQTPSKQEQRPQQQQLHPEILTKQQLPQIPPQTEKTLPEIKSSEQITPSQPITETQPKVTPIQENPQINPVEKESEKTQPEVKTELKMETSDIQPTVSSTETEKSKEKTETSTTEQNPPSQQEEQTEKEKETTTEPTTEKNLNPEEDVKEEDDKEHQEKKEQIKQKETATEKVEKTEKSKEATTMSTEITPEPIQE